MFHIDLRNGKFLVLVRKWNRHDRQYLLSDGSEMGVPGTASIWNKHDRGVMYPDDNFYHMDSRAQNLGKALTHLPYFRELVMSYDRVHVVFSRDVGTSDTQIDDLDIQISVLIGYCLVAPGIEVIVERF